MCGLFCTTAALSEEPGGLSLRPSGTLTMSAVVNPTMALPPSANSAPLVSAVSPSAKDYRIGAEDLLEIQVFGVDQLARTVRVNMRGFISLPLVGPVGVAGLTAPEAEALIVKKFGESYLQDPQVSLFIKEFTVQRVTIEGAVNRPGIFPIRGPTSLLQALA